MPDFFTMSHQETIVAAAARHRVPAIYAFRAFPASGGLMSYGMDMISVYRDAAAYVDRILRGEKPTTCRCRRRPNSSWSSISRPPKRSDSTLPPTLLARADEVIE